MGKLFLRTILSSFLVVWQHTLLKGQGESGGWFLVTFNATEDFEPAGRRIVIGDHILASMLGLCVRRY